MAIYLFIRVDANRMPGLEAQGWAYSPPNSPV